MKRFVISAVLTASLFVCQAQSPPHMRYEDKIRIREAIAIAQQTGPSVWEGIEKIPFAMILITDSIEFMIYHTAPTPDFIFLENDTTLQIPVYYRKRQYQTGWLATFPVNGINCI